jgi:hypothetical protein
MHPSGEYLLVVAINLYVFHLKTGELRAKIKVDKSLNSVSVDPSGLFAAINTNDSVYLYQIGTGKQVFKFEPKFAEIG